MAGREGAPSGYTVRPQHHIEKVIPKAVPLFGSSYNKTPKPKATKINKVVKLDGKSRKVGDGRSWFEVLFGSGKRK